MSYVSVFDILKIGVGPSSSHTLGPWRAARMFVNSMQKKELENKVDQIRVKLYGSLALTGKGHGTDIAVILGLTDADPETIPIKKVNEYPVLVKENNRLHLGGETEIDFSFEEDIEFNSGQQLEQHPNGMTIVAFGKEEELLSKTYFSVGGGFVLEEQNLDDITDISTNVNVPFDISSADELKQICKEQDITIAMLALRNELTIHNNEFVRERLNNIWDEMLKCIYRGCHTEGHLPGGLNVRRRAHDIYEQLSGGKFKEKDPHKWLNSLKGVEPNFTFMLRWISCFAMAVNEENANFSRVVTAPTNGAAGVIPAVLAYFVAFSGEHPTQEQIQHFLLTAGVVGGLYKNGATISAAMGGCQAEIGVSSSMAAVALTESLGGSIEQALMAGEIAMEHHLGMTCDPVNGLVQIPCIERNTMGAIKAITATNLALSSNPDFAKVSLDNVIQTMWETAQDMNKKYKETSLGGLATNISVIVPEC